MKLTHTQRRQETKVIDGMTVDAEAFAPRYLVLLEAARVLSTVQARLVLEQREKPDARFPCKAMIPDISAVLNNLDLAQWEDELL